MHKKIAKTFKIQFFFKNVQLVDFRAKYHKVLNHTKHECHFLCTSLYIFISNISEEDFSGSSLCSPLRIDFSDDEEDDDYTNPHPRRSKRSASKLKFEEPLQPLSNRNRGLRRTLDEGNFKILRNYFPCFLFSFLNLNLSHMATKIDYIERGL